MSTDQDYIAAASKALSRRTLQLRWQYWRGEQPRVWVTPKLRAMFRTLADSMNENYCDLAIHSRTTRLEVTGWAGTQSEQAQALWDATRMPHRQADLYRWGLVYGHTYLIVAEEDDGPVIAPNRPTLVWHLPDSDDPTDVEVAVKEWWSRDGWRATVYTDTEIIRYACTDHDQKADKRPDAARYILDPDDPGGVHGFERVPVIPIWPYGSEAPVLMDSISPIQDRINKIGANKFIAAEFGAFKQRVFFTRQAVEDGDLKNAPDTAIVLDPGDPSNPSRVQEMSATDLANYDNAKAAEVDALFTIALLPRHLRITGGAVPPSGRAIKADEGPLVEAIYDHHREFGEAYIEALGMLGIEAEPVWRSPVIGDEIDQGTAVVEFVNAGVPWQEAVKRYADWTDEDVAAAEGPGTGAGLTANPSATGAALLNAFASAPAEPLIPTGQPAGVPNGQSSEVR